MVIAGRSRYPDLALSPELYVAGAESETVNAVMFAGLLFFSLQKSGSSCLERRLISVLWAEPVPAFFRFMWDEEEHEDRFPDRYDGASNLLPDMELSPVSLRG